MLQRLRRTVAALAVGSVALSTALAACGSSDDSNGADSGAGASAHGAAEAESIDPPNYEDAFMAAWGV